MIPTSYIPTLRQCLGPRPSTDLDYRKRLYLIRNGYIEKFPLHRVDQPAGQERTCCLITQKGREELERIDNASGS